MRGQFLTAVPIVLWLYCAMADHPQDAATPPDADDAAFVYGPAPEAPDAPPQPLPGGDLWQEMMLRWIGTAEDAAMPSPPPESPSDIWW